MHSRQIDEYKKRVQLTKRQREILVGTLLGDGCLETSDNGRTYKLRTEHSIRQKEYVDWLYREFQPLVRTPPHARTRFTRLRTVEGYYTRYGFNTLGFASLRFYGQQYYPGGGRKIVPPLIHKWLTPLALAVWFMDDGSIKSNTHRTVLFNTHAFDVVSLKRLQTVFLERFGVKTTLRKQREGTQIYLLSETVDVFLKLIEPYIMPSMRYKLPKVWLTQLPKW